jgi:hypothetical protein
MSATRAQTRIDSLAVGFVAGAPSFALEPERGWQRMVATRLIRLGMLVRKHVISENWSRYPPFWVHVIGLD